MKLTPWNIIKEIWKLPNTEIEDGVIVRFIKSQEF